MRQQDYLQWRMSSVTKEFFEQLFEQGQSIEEDTVTGGCLAESPGMTAQKYAERVGFTAAMRVVGNFEPEFDDED